MYPPIFGTPIREGKRNLPAQRWWGARNERLRPTYVNLC